MELFADVASTTVTSGGTTAPVSGTVETWTGASWASFPAASATAGTQFHIADPAATGEMILVTNVSGATATVTRGAEGTVPVVHAPGFTVVQVITAGFLGLLPQGIVQLLPSGDTSGTTDTANMTAAITALGTAGGLISLAAGTFWWTPGSVSVTNPGVYIQGAGVNATFVKAPAASGAGDMVRMTFAGTYNGNTTVGGGITGIYFDGTNCAAGSSGIHIGDIFDLHVDVVVFHFQGSGSIGARFDNSVHFTERLHGRVDAYACQSGVVFDVTGTGTNSFARTDLDIYVNQENAGFDGIVLRAGAAVYDGRLKFRGNFTSSGSSTTAAALRITGSVGGLGVNFSNIGTCSLEIGAECASGAFTPQTIVFGAGGNTIGNCTGVMDWSAAGTNFTASNNSSNLIRFYGPVRGDATLPTWLPVFRTNITAGSGQAISGTAPSAVTSVLGALTPFTPFGISMFVPYSSTAVAGNPVFTLASPSMSVANLFFKFYAGAGAVQTSVLTSVSGTVTGPVLTSSSDLLLEVTGTVLPSASGTLQLQAAEGTGGDPFTISRGASMTVVPYTAP